MPDRVTVVLTVTFECNRANYFANDDLCSAIVGCLSDPTNVHFKEVDCAYKDDKAAIAER